VRGGDATLRQITLTTCQSKDRSVVLIIDVKNVFTFFYFGHVFNVFFIFQTFFYLKKTLAQSSERQADYQEALLK